jgi:phage tail-like protein
MALAELLPAFRFQVKLRRSPAGEAGLAGRGGASPAAGAALADGAFQECSGLEIEMVVRELEEGGRNAGVIRLPGRARYQNIVLKRGMFYADGEVNGELWRWLQLVLAGERPVPRYDGTVEVMTAAGEVAARWEFDRGLPAKVVGPALNGRTGEIAIEELHIAHEGLRLGDGV